MHGTNFVGAKNHLKDLWAFLKDHACKESKSCVRILQYTQRIEQSFILERVPQSAVKSMKYHLKRVTANIKFTFEEYTQLS